MAWECCKVEEQRLRLIQEFIGGDASMTQICKKYHISRKTAYKWYHRFALLGEEGLKDLSRAPNGTVRRPHVQAPGADGTTRPPRRRAHGLLKNIGAKVAATPSQPPSAFVPSLPSSNGPAPQASLRAKRRAKARSERLNGTAVPRWQRRGWGRRGRRLARSGRPPRPPC